MQASSIRMYLLETREIMPLRAAAEAAAVENWMKTDSPLYFLIWASLNSLLPLLQ